MGSDELTPTDAQLDTDDTLDQVALYIDPLFFTGVVLYGLVKLNAYPAYSPRYIMGAVGLAALWSIGVSVFPLARTTKLASFKTAQYVRANR